MSHWNCNLLFRQEIQLFPRFVFRGLVVFLVPHILLWTFSLVSSKVQWMIILFNFYQQCSWLCHCIVIGQAVHWLEMHKPFIVVRTGGFHFDQRGKRKKVFFFFLNASYSIWSIERYIFGFILHWCSPTTCFTMASIYPPIFKASLYNYNQKTL